MRKRHKIINIILPLLICVALTACIFEFSHRAGVQVKEQSVERISETLDSRANSINSFISDLFITLESHAAYIAYDDITDVNMLRNELRCIADTCGYKSLSFIKTTGEIVMTAGVTPIPETLEASKHNMPKNVRFVEYIADTDTPLLVLGAPVSYSDTVIGYLCGEFSSATFLDTVMVHTYLSSPITYITNRSGDILMSTDTEKIDNFFSYFGSVDMDTDYEKQTMKYDMLTLSGNLFTFSDLVGSYYCTYKPLQVYGNNWYIIMSIPCTDVDAYGNTITHDAYILAAEILSLCLLIMLILLCQASRRRKADLEAEKNRNENYAKTAFVAELSHEIRTPLNTICGVTGLALKNTDDPVKTRDSLIKINLAAQILTDTVDEVIDMSIIENGRIELAHSRFDIKFLMRRVCAVYGDECKNKQLKFRFVLSDITNETLIGDRTRLNTILVALLNNALKFTEKGSVELRVEQEPSSNKNAVLTRFIIKDTGIGIPDNMKSRVFLPFERVDKDVKGLGLGLTISKRLAEAFGGGISFESVEGEGSTFTVTLPFEVSSDAATSDQTLSQLRVLLLCDDKPTCDTIQEYITDFGATCDAVSANNIAFEVLRNGAKHRTPYDICLISADSNEDRVMASALISSNYPAMATVLLSDKALAVPDSLRTMRVPASQFDLLNDILSLMKVPHEVSDDVSKFDFTGKRLLVVEDNVMNMEIASELLKSVGFTCVCAENGQAALSTFTSSAEYEFDAILMDIQMPVMNGLDAAEAIRKLSRADAKSVPILAMTANAFASDIEKSLAAGMNCHISKPLDPQMLFSALRKVL